MTDWIDREPCPYRQEAYAVVLHTLLTEQSDDEQFRVSPYVREQIETSIVRIIRRAFTDQIAEEMLHSGHASDVHSAPIVSMVEQTQRFDRLEQQVNHLQTVVESLCTQRVDSTQYCRYLVPNDIWTMDEMEQQLKGKVHASAPTLAAYLHRCEKQGYMRFDSESAPAIYRYLNERYSLPYGVSAFQKAW